MADDFKRILSFKSKPKAKLVGELKESQIICPELGASPFLSLFLTESGHSSQFHEALPFNSRYFAYQDKIIACFKDILPFEIKETLKNGLAEIVGEINDREIVFNKALPSDIYFYSWRSSMQVLVPEKECSRQAENPIFIGIYGKEAGFHGKFTFIPCFSYRNKIVAIEGVKYLHVSPFTVLPNDDVLLVKHFVLKQEHAFEKIKTQVEAFERFEKALKSKREPIPEDVKMFVWRRDEGKCVKCGSQMNLEFDHIIPLSKGGSNTERNIQLLCETCNRQKSDTI